MAGKWHLHVHNDRCLWHNGIVLSHREVMDPAGRRSGANGHLHSIAAFNQLLSEASLTRQSRQAMH